MAEVEGYEYNKVRMSTYGNGGIKITAWNIPHTYLPVIREDYTAEQMEQAKARYDELREQIGQEK